MQMGLTVNTDIHDKPRGSFLFNVVPFKEKLAYLTGINNSDVMEEILFDCVKQCLGFPMWHEQLILVLNGYNTEQQFDVINVSHELLSMVKLLIHPLLQLVDMEDGIKIRDFKLSYNLVEIRLINRNYHLNNQPQASEENWDYVS